MSTTFRRARTGLYIPHASGGGGSTPTFVGVTTSIAASGSTRTITPHSSAQVDDYAIIHVGCHYQISTGPSGWAATGVTTGGFINGGTYVKRLTLGDLNTAVTVTFSGSEQTSMVCVVYRNVAAVAKKGITAIFHGNTAPATVDTVDTAGSLTDELGVYGVFTRADSTPSVNVGTVRSSIGTDVGYTVNEQVWASAGSVVLSTNATSSGYYGTSWALRKTTSEAYRTAVFAKNPLAYYRSADLTNNCVPNIAGTGAGDMTITGSPTAGGSAPKTVGSISWPTGAAYATTTDQLTIPNANSFAVEAWVYLTANPTATTSVFGNGQSYNSGSFSEFGLTVDTSGKPGFYLYNGLNIAGASALSLNTWHHLVAVVDSTASPVIRLRVDKTTVASKSTGSPSLSTRSLFIHGAGGQSSTPSAMVTAEHAIYGAALSDAEIDAHYDAA